MPSTADNISTTSKSSKSKPGKTSLKISKAGKKSDVSRELQQSSSKEKGGKTNDVVMDDAVDIDRVQSQNESEHEDKDSIGEVSFFILSFLFYLSCI
jgi:hypothetical protein